MLSGGKKREMIKMMDKGVCKILTILVAFVMVVSCAAMPSAVAVSKSEVNVSNPDNTSSTELNKNQKTRFLLLPANKHLSKPQRAALPIAFEPEHYNKHRKQNC
jgi:hypothetical protein